MRFGLGIPTCREGLAYPSGFADLQMTARLAQVAERVGFDALWANDHLATQRVILDELPAPPNFYEPVVTFAYLASQAPRLVFMLATVVAPLREPVLLAKQIATLDQASGGRVILGLGIGAYREELEAVNREAARINRGRIMEETVTALRLLFTRRRAQFSGTYLGFAEIEVFPKPVQTPLPIYLSGNSPQAIRRAAALADGWILAAASPERTAAAVSQLRTHAVAAGRDPAEIEVCLQTWVSIGATAEDAVDRLRASQHFRRLRALHPSDDLNALTHSFAENNLLGTSEQINDQLAAYERAGVDHLGLVFLANTADDLMQQVELFGKQVLLGRPGVSVMELQGEQA